jgi:4a-hydroxytetrahydrobiopterin dehydratase
MSAELPEGWTGDAMSIRRTYELAGFTAAVALIGKIAILAEEADHHPDVHLTRYRRLDIVLTTHDAGKVTARDYELAAKIEALPKLLKPRA